MALPRKRTRTKKPTSDYFLKLQSPKWQKVRLKVLERAEWACETCGSEENTLTVHHGYYRYGVEPWDLPLNTLWCVCSDCHSEYQEELTRLKVAIGRLYPQDYYNILQEIENCPGTRKA